jgi:soluble lytic murein transglycosylase
MFKIQGPAKIIFTALIFITANSHAQNNLKWEDLNQDGRASEAYTLAKSQLQGAKKDFYLGVLAYQAKQWDDATAYLSEALPANRELNDYIYLYRGQAFLAKNEPQKALDDFKRAEELSHLNFVGYVAEFYQAEIYQNLKQWKKADPIYKKLAKKLKSTKYFPAVLWGSLISQMSDGKSQRICRQAKELFLKFPAYEKVADWGIVLGNNMVNGKKLNCVTTFSEQKLRLQRMLWAGMEDKALEEIGFLKSNAHGSSKYLVDEVMVSYLLHEGHVDEAQKILDTYAASMGNDPDYLLLVGKVNSRANNPEKGVDAYYRASKMLRGNSAAAALFQAGFLSYLAQDYKGAGEKFLEFSQKFAGHRLISDITWYQGWLKYLQKDYVGAEKDFVAILEMKNKKPRAWKEHKEDKINYWIAMSLLRQEKRDRAIEMFSQLTNDEAVGYYSVAAYQRLSQISQRQLASNSPIKFSVHENWWLPEALANGGKKDKDEDALAVPLDPFEVKVDAMLSYEDKGSEALSEDLTVAPGAVPASHLESDVKSVYFNNVDRSIQRANALIHVGEDELAYREVIETEGQRLTNQQKLWLLKAHQSINSYNRSVVLASYFFSDEVAKLGLYHGSDYWNYSYPKAYDKTVQKYAKQWQIPQELIWSIMRAETIYRPDAISPVGARGLMQVMPKTGRKLASMTGENFEVDDLLKSTVSIKMGGYYLQRLMKKFKGNIPLVAAAYNGGPHRVQGWMHYFGGLELDEFVEHIPYQETRNYVKKVTKYYAIYNLLYNKKTDAMNVLAKPIGFKLEGTIPSMETWERYE